jgi:hypothetical protein
VDRLKDSRLSAAILEALSGLVLSRQIAEAHGGTLTQNARARGCEARVSLPY